MTVTDLNTTAMDYILVPRVFMDVTITVILTLTIIDDDIVEPEESFIITLDDGDPTTTDPMLTVTIMDNDIGR